MLVVFPLLISSTIPVKLSLGICKAVERFIIVYMMNDVLNVYQSDGVVTLELQRCSDHFHITMILDRDTDYESELGDAIEYESPDDAILYFINQITPVGTVSLLTDGIDITDISSYVDSGNPIRIEIKTAPN